MSAWEASLALPRSLNSLCLLQTPLNTDIFYGPLSVCINPLSPNGDQRQFSPNNIYICGQENWLRELIK